MASRSDVATRETTNTAIQFQLLSGTVGINLTAITKIELWLKDRDGGTAMTDNLTGKLNVNGSAGGSVTWTPGSADLAAGSAPYSAYFKVFTGPTSWYFVPESSEFTVSVRSKF